MTLVDEGPAAEPPAEKAPRQIDPDLAAFGVGAESASSGPRRVRLEGNMNFTLFGGTIESFKERWQKAYHSVAVKPKPRSARATWLGQETRERIGMIVMLALLCAALAGLTALVKLADRRSAT